MGYVHEFQNENNDITPRAISITKAFAPDLVVSTVTPPATATVGRAFDVSYTVTNSGPGAVPDRQNVWSDSVYLSRDRYLDVRSDHFLGSIGRIDAV